MEGATAQLFDIEADPDELDDRIDDETLAPLRAELEAELRAIVDPEDLDADVRAEQRTRLEAAGGLGRVSAGRNGDLPRTDHGVIAPGWTIPPPEIMDVVRQDSAET